MSRVCSVNIELEVAGQFGNGRLLGRYLQAERLQVEQLCVNETLDETGHVGRRSRVEQYEYAFVPGVDDLFTLTGQHHVLVDFFHVRSFACQIQYVVLF